jgi:signal transduction histidine kinase
MWFSASDCVDLALELMEESIRCNRIHIAFEHKTDFEVYGYANEFSHAVYNLINNARDAVLEEEHGRIIEIIIALMPEEKIGILRIKNFGNKIDSEILETIFTPYFTTKDQGKGTGIGLSISQTIIEQRMEGKLEIQNLGDGVCCTITMKNIRSKAVNQV